VDSAHVLRLAETLVVMLKMRPESYSVSVSESMKVGGTHYRVHLWTSTSVSVTTGNDSTMCAAVPVPQNF
jgi:hypothetical protein